MDRLLCHSLPASSFTFGADPSDLAVTATLLQLPTAAGMSHSKGNAGGGDGVDESRLPRACSGVRNGCFGGIGKSFFPGLQQKGTVASENKV